ncbi:hypothetical protein [Brevundimonas olei]|uniref:hypothetical protein n=1 Tax=Brevundimonas olei TaxID=657642 RepID=UPI0031DB4A1F
MSKTVPVMVDKDGEPVVKGRIRPALDTAIRLIEENGYTIADAAKSVGYRTHSLVQALHKPHVRAHRASVKRAWREAESSKAWVTMAKLASGAASEDVQFKSAKFLIEMDEAAAGRMPAETHQTIQIIARNVNLPANLGNNQMSGVIEAEPFQLPSVNPSNSRSVGRDESEEGDDE